MLFVEKSVSYYKNCILNKATIYNIQEVECIILFHNFISDS